MGFWRIWEFLLTFFGFSFKNKEIGFKNVVIFIVMTSGRQSPSLFHQVARFILDRGKLDIGIIGVCVPHWRIFRVHVSFKLDKSCYIKTISIFPDTFITMMIQSLVVRVHLLSNNNMIIRGCKLYVYFIFILWHVLQITVFQLY